MAVPTLEAVEARNRRLTRLVKEYAIVRTVFGASPRNAALTNRLDSLIAADDLDLLYQLAPDRPEN